MLACLPAHLALFTWFMAVEMNWHNTPGREIQDRAIMLLEANFKAEEMGWISSHFLQKGEVEAIMTKGRSYLNRNTDTWVKA